MGASPVLVAGAGIGGLAAALALAAAGRDVLVLERAPALSEVGAGLQMSPNATRRLVRWGVLDRLREVATAPASVTIRRGSDGAQIARIPLQDAQKRWGAPYLVVFRADLLAALAARVAQTPHIVMRLGARLTGWREDAVGVTAHIETTPEGDISHVQCSALIGADGLRSRVREGLASDAPYYTGRTAWRTLVPADLAPDFARKSASNLWLGSGAHLVHYPLRGAQVVNVVAVVQDDWQDTQDEEIFWAARGDPSFLHRRFKDWTQAARDLLTVAPEWRRWPLYERRALKHWARGRVGLLGDAAHAMEPFLAQGAAQAIEDADALGQAFAQTPDDPATALRHYEAARIKRATRVQNASRQQGKVYHLGAPAAFARDAAMRLIGPRGMTQASDWIYRG